MTIPRFTWTWPSTRAAWAITGFVGLPKMAEKAKYVPPMMAINRGMLKASPTQMNTNDERCCFPRLRGVGLAICVIVFPPILYRHDAFFLKSVKSIPGSYHKQITALPGNITLPSQADRLRPWNITALRE